MYPPTPLGPRRVLNHLSRLGGPVACISQPFISLFKIDLFLLLSGTPSHETRKIYPLTDIWNISNLLFKNKSGRNTLIWILILLYMPPPCGDHLFLAFCSRGWFRVLRSDRDMLTSSDCMLYGHASRTQKEARGDSLRAAFPSLK